MKIEMEDMRPIAEALPQIRDEDPRLDAGKQKGVIVDQPLYCEPHRTLAEI